jgi:two-component system cell cycle response regulator
MNGVTMRILLVAQAREARRLLGLLNLGTSSQFLVTHAPDLEVAIKRLSREDTDILLLDVGSNPERARAAVRTACAAAAFLPLVILSEFEDESLAVESLQCGAQDFLAKGCLDCSVLIRSLRYGIERHRLQKTLQNMSLRDDLTGLHNRRGFLALAEQHLRLIRRKGAALLVYLDLDNLKAINDTLGHPEGNRALAETANILRASFRQSDILGRLGGDEFAVLMIDARRDTAMQVQTRLQQQVEFLNGLAGRRYPLSFSVGIAEVPAVGQPEIEHLLSLADTLMYEQKRNKRKQLPAALPTKDHIFA